MDVYFRPIPDQGNTAEIVLTALHHNALGIDEFLGRVAIPLNSLDTYERPKNKWYVLESKPGKFPFLLLLLLLPMTILCFNF